MPNIKSAKKRVKVISNKTLRNQMIKSNLKTCIKNFDAFAAKADKAKAELDDAQQETSEPVASLFGLFLRTGAGILPVGLKRGVLSQDGLYCLLMG